MRWWIEVSAEARSNLKTIRHTKEEVKAISKHLAGLATQVEPGEPIRVIDGREARYSACERFAIVFQLVASHSQPPGKLVVNSINTLSR